MHFKNLFPLVLVAVVGVIETPAALISADIAADNSFALYTGNANGTSLTYVGRNTEHWMTTHSFDFSMNEGDYLYLAAWSDDGTAQGIIGQFEVQGSETILTGTNWDVHMTNKDIDDYFAVQPTQTDVASEIGENTWADVSYTLANGAAPWGLRSGISTSSNWMWGVPLTPGSGGAGEYQIFRIQVGTASVPEPGSLMLLGLGLTSLVTASFRRRK